MKNHLLTLTVRIEVESQLSSLSDRIQEVEQQTRYEFADTENVRVVETEILQTEIF